VSESDQKNDTPGLCNPEALEFELRFFHSNEAPVSLELNRASRSQCGTGGCEVCGRQFVQTKRCGQ